MHRLARFPTPLALFFLVLVLSSIKASPTSPTFEGQCGHCSTTESCIYSPGRKNGKDYNADDHCTFQVLKNATISYVNHFDLQYSDNLIVNDVTFNKMGPVRMSVTAGDRITFHSNSYSHSKGFQVCALPNCTQTNGLLVNSNQCMCNMRACTKETGLFCHDQLERCSPLMIDPNQEHFISTGKCKVNGHCFQTDNFGNQQSYAGSSTCRIKVLIGGSLGVVAFDTKSGDTLTISGQEYSETDGPIGVTVQAGQTFEIGISLSEDSIEEYQYYCLVNHFTLAT